MNRRSFIARCASAVAAVVFPWRSASGVNREASFAKLASKFQWECAYIPAKSAHLIHCWGEFQDGLEYECADYIDFEEEMDLHGNAFLGEGPEAILSEVAITFDQAMRRRFDQIEKDDRTESS